MMVGFSMVLGPLGVLGDVVPFIGSIVRLGTGLISGVLAVAISLVVIALAWLTFRPLFALALLAVAGVAVAGIVMLRKRRTPPLAATVQS